MSATERDGTQIKQPPQSVFEKVAFIFNNLCTNNIMEKVKIRKILTIPMKKNIFCISKDSRD